MNPNSPCGGAVGGDCDQDGVPNSIDVDDNGNLTIDFTDTTTPVAGCGEARMQRSRRLAQQDVQAVFRFGQAGFRPF